MLPNIGKIRCFLVSLSIAASGVASSDVQCRRSIIHIANVDYRIFDLVSYAEATFGALTLDRCNGTESPRSSESKLYIDPDGNFIARSPKNTTHIYLIKHDKYFKIMTAEPYLHYAVGKDAIFTVRNKQLHCIDLTVPRILRKDNIDFTIIAQARNSVRSIAVDSYSGDMLLATSSGDGIVRVMLMTRAGVNTCRKDDIQIEDYKYNLRSVLDNRFQDYRGTTPREGQNCVDMGQVMKLAFMDCTIRFGHHVYNESSSHDFEQNTNHTKNDDRGIHSNETVSVGGLPIEAVMPSGVDVTVGSNNGSVTNTSRVGNDSEIILHAKNSLQTLVDGTNLIEPFFEEASSAVVILAKDITEEEQGQFYCIDKNKGKSLQRSVSAAETQYSALMQGLRILKNEFENGHEVEKYNTAEYEISSIDVRFGA